MLAGAYSKQYQNLEREHLNTLKNTTYDVKIDILARAKRLSNETNRRRKAQAIKRRNEALKEEKRRKEILAKRHEEQKIATERFQRSHIPNSRPTSSKTIRYHSIPIDDALKLVRGSSPISRQHNYTQHGGRTSPLPAGNYPSDPLSRPYVGKHKNRHHPSSAGHLGGRTDHSEMKDKSLRNWNDSRSLFEQQLEQHQQLLLDQQQKSLYEFNEAISSEIAKDEKINGTEDGDDSPNLCDESLSSVDSLEDSLNYRNRSKDLEKAEEQEILAHNVIYPVAMGSSLKEGFYLETKNGNKPSNKDTHAHSSSLRANIPLSYSDLVSHNATTYQLSQPNSGIGTVPVSNTSAKPTYVLSGGMLHTNYTPVSLATQHVPDMEYDRPSANVKMWVDSPRSDNVNSNTIPANNAQTGKVDYNNRGTVLATPYTNPTPQVKPRTLFTTANVSSAANNVSSTSSHYSSGTASQANSAITATTITRFYSDPVPQHKHNQNDHLSSTSSKLPSTTSAPTSLVSTTNSKSLSAVSQNAKPKSETEQRTGLAGNILDGTLSLVEGKLMSATLEAKPKVPGDGVCPAPTQYSTGSQNQIAQSNTATSGVTRTNSVDNIVGILKKSPSSNSIKIDMRDSVEVAKLQRQMSEDLKKRPKSGKKSVRFADLSDEEEEDILVPSFSSQDTPKKINLRNARAGGKNRVTSAKVVSKMAKVPPSAAKPPRAMSAGSKRSMALKPKAVAHIIHQDPGQSEQADVFYMNLQAELENKKVTIVNNNFMGKVATTTQQNTPGVTNGNHPGQALNQVQLKMTDASKNITVPTSSTSPPQGTIAYKNQPVYNENGVRIDRTPTDDEINELWETVRTCLHPNDEERSNCSQTQSDSILASRQKAPVSHTVIDGDALGLMGLSARVSSAYQQRTASKVYQPRLASQGASNGYLKKYGLLQQRRQQEKANARSANNPDKRESMMPQIAQSNNLPNKKEEVSDSMNMFMMAEQLANRSIPESQIYHAMDEMQTRQLMSNNNNIVPSALSIEEQRLIESLDRLNEKLKTAETNYPQTNQQLSNQVAHPQNPPPVHDNQHTSGFRGRRPISSHQRRHTDGVRTDYLLRAASAYNSQRHYR